jgi:hypothetical protein
MMKRRSKIFLGERTQKPPKSKNCVIGRPSFRGKKCDEIGADSLGLVRGKGNGKGMAQIRKMPPNARHTEASVTVLVRRLVAATPTPWAMCMSALCRMGTSLARGGRLRREGRKCLFERFSFAGRTSLRAIAQRTSQVFEAMSAIGARKFVERHGSTPYLLIALTTVSTSP